MEVIKGTTTVCRNGIRVKTPNKRIIIATYPNSPNKRYIQIRRLLSEKEQIELTNHFTDITTEELIIDKDTSVFKKKLLVKTLSISAETIEILAVGLNTYCSEGFLEPSK